MKIIKFSGCLFLILFAFLCRAQDNSEEWEKGRAAARKKNDIDTVKKESGWLKGYVVMKVGGDTVSGILHDPKIKTELDWVNFKLNDGSEIRRFRSDSITAFKYGNTEYKFFKYSGWSKLLANGAITIYKGSFEQVVIVLPGVPSIKIIECMVYKKGEEKAKFVGADEVVFFSGALKEKTKTDFEDYISNDPVILAEFRKEKFLYADLPKLILKYNQRAKQK